MIRNNKHVKYQIIYMTSTSNVRDSLPQYLGMYKNQCFAICLTAARIFPGHYPHSCVYMYVCVCIYAYVCASILRKYSFFIFRNNLQLYGGGK